MRPPLIAAPASPFHPRSELEPGAAPRAELGDPGPWGAQEGPGEPLGAQQGAGNVGFGERGEDAQRRCWSSGRDKNDPTEKNGKGWEAKEVKGSSTTGKAHQAFGGMVWDG